MAAGLVFGILMLGVLTALDAWDGEELSEALPGNLAQSAVTTVLWSIFMWFVVWRRGRRP